MGERWGSRRHIDPALGLHQLAPSLQLRYFADQCREILGILERLVENTRTAVPRREKDWHLDRSPDPEFCPAEEESRWERAMYDTWGPTTRTTEFLPVCPYIQTYQFPLKKKRADAQWGKIDLLGVSSAATPVVIELKKSDSPETPLRMLLEACAYGIALQECWPLFRSSWHACTYTLNATLPSQLAPVSVICIAPQQYWDRCLGRFGDRGSIPINGWEPFWSLLDALANRFKIHFAVVHGCYVENRICVTHAELLDLRSVTGS